MFYLIHGKNRNKSSTKAISLIEGLIAKKPDASYIKVGKDEWTESFFEEFGGTAGLFENKSVILVDNLWSEDLPTEDDIDRMNDSENIFILIENNLSKDSLSKLKSKAKQVIDVGDEVKKEQFNVFLISDAYAEKDKKKLWLLYRQGILSGADVEDFINIIYWQIKNLILAKRGLLNGALKLNPFVISKAKGYAKKWEEVELVNHSEYLVNMLHNSRLGKTDLEIAFEKWILDM